ncbi:MAG: hypothetical protein NTZ44_00600 [Candidatus Nomurabacteria bacterium]|nr:hypothetical protein [Candidatus Nomurabacteria bacterium]
MILDTHIKLLWLNGGAKAQLVFDNGSKSKTYKTKIEVLNLISKLRSFNQISTMNASALGLEIQEAEKIILGKMPFKIRRKKIIQMKSELFTDLNDFLTEMVTDSEYLESSETVKQAYFLICEGCGRHGKIYFRGGGRTTEIHSKKEGFGWIKILKKRKKVTNNEVTKLTKEINESGLEPD